MRKLTWIAAFLVPVMSLIAAPARAANPALVSQVEKYLRDDEKAFLAAILTRPELSAEFDAEAPLALKDPKNLTPFLGLWRGKIVQYAEVDSKLPYPNLDGRYTSFSQLMTAQQKAYMMRRLPTMKEDDRNSLIDYLKKVNDDLQKNGQLTCTLGFCYTKKIVQGIMDHYKTDLTTYLETPIAQTAKREMPASAAEFGAIVKADQDARAAASRPAPAPAEPPQVAQAPKKPATKPAPKKPEPKAEPKPEPATTDSPGSVAVAPPAGGALDQARDAANHGAPVFDGGSPAKSPTSSDAVVVPPSGLNGPRPSLSPSAPGAQSGLVGSIPDVPAPKAPGDDMDALLKMRTDKPAPASWASRLPTIGGGLIGGLLGALVGFLVGGPIGALIGGGIGIGAGAIGGRMLVKKLTGDQ